MNTKFVRKNIYTLLGNRGSAEDCEYFADVINNAQTKEEKEIILKVYEQAKEAFITDWWGNRNPDEQRDLVECSMHELRKNL